MDLSEIQVKILTKFITSEGLRYSDAKPEGVDNDLYKYHLKFLVTKGYIEKEGDKYILTDDGKLFGLNLNVYGEIQNGFKIAVNCIVLISEDGVDKVLIQKRLRHPNYGEISTVCGKVQRGEKVIDCANRKLKEETGLEADFKYIGQLRAIRYNKLGKIINDQWFNVCLATSYSGILIEDNKYWENYFYNVSELGKLEKSLPIKNLIEILQKLRNDDIPFLIEDEATLEEI